VGNPRHSLLDDRPIVERFCPVVSRRTDQFDPALVSLPMRLCSNKRREKRVMKFG
jgi:hypothetical protein